MGISRGTTGRRGAVHALLVGINDYGPDAAHAALRGCRNDVAAVREWLEENVAGPLSVHELLDGDATRAAVTAAVRDHLGQVGPGDTALFWFSGHGTHLVTGDGGRPRRESAGRVPAMACVDGPVLDRELGALLDGVAAGGAHTVAVMDCCYSGGPTRDTTLTPRFLAPSPRWQLPYPAEPFGATTDARADADADADPDAGAAPARRYVVLGAGRPRQLSYEKRIEGRVHGLFTWSLLDALTSGAWSGATYRELLVAAHGRVQTMEARQHPVLLPSEPGGVADQPFLGGAVRTSAPHLLRHGREGWEVDCGTAHGLRGGRSLGTEFAVAGEAVPASRAGRVRAVDVRVDHTLVAASGWTPDESLVYPVEVSALALPPATVVVDDTADPTAGLWLREAITGAHPDGGPTPLLRTEVVGAEGHGGLLRLRAVLRGGRAVLLRRDGTPAVPPLPLTERADARRVVACLIHLTRWHQARALSNPASPLGGLVRIEVVPWDGGPPLTAAPGEDVVVRYGGAPGRWEEPWVSLRIRNTSRTRTLWCALLDLTDSYAGHSALYPGGFIGPGRTGFALDGDPVRLSLPPSRPPRPGAYARDWLKLIVAEGELNTLPFQLPPWNPGGPATARTTGPAADGVWRLAPDGARDADVSPGQWGTAPTVVLRTVVPPATASGT